MLKRSLIVGSVLAAGIGLLAAQAPPPPAAPGTPAQPGQPAATTKTYRAKELLGTRMAIEGNTNVGTVDDIVFSDDGVIQYLIVTTADRKLFTVPWEAAKFDWAQRTAVITITPERFRTIPTYTVETYPQFYTPTYRTEIYKVYGRTPGPEGRLARPLRRYDRRDDRRP
jgi:hypothetical protein